MPGIPADGPREADFASRRLAVTVVQAGRAGVRRVEADVLRPLGLSFSGYELLLHLWLRGPHESRDLARVLGVSVPSITSLVNTLERRGLVARERTAADGRLVSIGITYDGIALASAAQLGVHRVQSQAAAALSTEEQRAMQGYLDRYLAAIGESRVDFAGTRQEISEPYLAAASGRDAPPPRRTGGATADPRPASPQRQPAGSGGAINRIQEVVTT